MQSQLRHRINAGRVAVKNQVGFFEAQFGQVASEWKPDDTRVTFVDFAISEKILAALRVSFPEDEFFSEESDPDGEVHALRARFAWVLDPIDGTNNYALGMSLCAISLALLERGVPVYGFIYDLSRRVLMEGGPGMGLWEGGTRAEASRLALDERGVVGLHFPMTETDLQRYGVLLSTYRVRALGSGALALAYVAAGRMEGCVDARVKVWDIAAAWALAMGGGAEVHFLSPSPFPMRQFHVRTSTLHYYAGSQAFCARMAALG